MCYAKKNNVIFWLSNPNKSSDSSSHKPKYVESIWFLLKYIYKFSNIEWRLIKIDESIDILNRESFLVLDAQKFFINKFEACLIKEHIIQF